MQDEKKRAVFRMISAVFLILRIPCGSGKPASIFAV